MAIDPSRLVLLGSAVATYLLALLVLTRGPGRGLHRAFAALLVCRATTLLLPQLSTDPAWTRAALATQPYFLLALVPIGLYCLLSLDVPPGPTRTRLGWAAVAAAALLDGAYALEHTWFQTLAAGEASMGALRAGPGLVFTDFGPLAAIASLWSVILGLLALRFAMRYRHLARTPLARPWLLLTAGFVLGALFDGTNRLGALAMLLDDADTGAFPWMPWGGLTVLLPPLTLLPAGLAVAVLAANRGVDPRPQSALEGTVLVLAAFATASGLLRLLLPSDSDVAAHPTILVLMGLWRLAMPLFVTAGLLDAPAHAVAEADPAAQRATA